MSTDDEIEREIVEKGLTAPRITPEMIENTIACENYFTAAQAAEGCGQPVHEAHRHLTICVLVLRNGFTIVGTSACASPENFDAELGRRIARMDAVNQIWSLEGYRLRSELSRS